MKAAALAFLLVAPLALGQTSGQPAEKKEPEKKQEPPKPLILRIDQLPPSERAKIEVTEDVRKKDDLPELGGKPSSAYDSAGVRGSGTEGAGSPYPANTQQGR